jgi:hypothetical protein
MFRIGFQWSATAACCLATDARHHAVEVGSKFAAAGRMPAHLVPIRNTLSQKKIGWGTAHLCPNRTSIRFHPPYRETIIRIGSKCLIREVTMLLKHAQQ